MTLQERYERLCATPSSINALLPVLRDYASRVESAAEFGVDIGQSTTAFLMAQPKSLVSWDVIWKPELSELFEAADESWNHNKFIRSRFGKTWWWLERQDSRAGDLPECDLLLIDSVHSFDQMKAELERHHAQVRKFILCHDYIAYGEFGEAGPPQIGIMPALTEFLAAHHEWVERERISVNNGLFIMERVSD